MDSLAKVTKDVVGDFLTLEYSGPILLEPSAYTIICRMEMEKSMLLSACAESST